MRRRALFAILTVAGLTVIAVPGMRPQAATAQYMPERLVVFETFGREA